MLLNVYNPPITAHKRYHGLSETPRGKRINLGLLIQGTSEDWPSPSFPIATTDRKASRAGPNRAISQQASLHL